MFAQLRLDELLEFEPNVGLVPNGPVCRNAHLEKVTVHSLVHPDDVVGSHDLMPALLGLIHQLLPDIVTVFQEKEDFHQLLHLKQVLGLTHIQRRENIPNACQPPT